MIETGELKTRSGLTFTIDAAGPAGGVLVLLLHGFPKSRHSWRAALPELARAGYRAVAPDQRGYSAGARPDPANLDNYSSTSSSPMRSRSPMPPARRAGASTWSATTGAGRSRGEWPMRIPSGLRRSPSCRVRIHSPSAARCRKTPTRKTGRVTTASSSSRHRGQAAGRQRQAHARGVVRSECQVGETASRHSGTRPALEAALAWYRANKGLSGDFGAIKVPTLYIWGDADATVGPVAAKGTGEFVSAVYAMEVLPGVGHFVMDQAAAQATELLLAHIKRHPA